MRKSYQIFIWKKAPFLRLLIPLIAGIILQFYLKMPIKIITASSIILLSVFILFSFLPEAIRFRFKMIQGIVISLFLMAFGSLVTWKKDIRNQSAWYGNYTDSGSFIVATIKEPPVEKPKSYKALATVEVVVNKEFHQKLTGKVLIYFAKDSASSKLAYGNKVIFQKPLQAIKNSGNPGAFDYARYCSFQQIYQQVFLKRDEWVLSQQTNRSFFTAIIYKTRAYVLQALTHYIPGNDESSLAKALLIGYRMDVDKDLVQAYSNAGVVHLIAISGMHLGFIYFILTWIFARIPFINRSKILKLVLILFCLWFFALLTGAPASVLRAAVMFTFIAIGDSFQKRKSSYNLLAASAFILLVYDPFLLWDVGFQLSYLAVLGILIFQKYIYHWFYFKNKVLNWMWTGASLSLAAQLLTLPVCIFYFHQFPLLFLLSNMIAIPLSTAALWGCLAIIFLSYVPRLAALAGKLTWCIIWLLNHFILSISAIPFSLWSGLFISITGVIILYFILIAFAHSFIKKNKTAFKLAVGASLVFVSITTYSQWKSFNQKKIIIYNVSQHQAIDFIRGHDYHFVGDSVLNEKNQLTVYNIKPAHIDFQLTHSSDLSSIFYKKNNLCQFYNTHFLIADSSIAYFPLPGKIHIDYIIISKNPKLKIADLTKNFDCSNFIFDASNPPWKIEQWKKECEELHLHFHSVSEQGAFVINL
jgi:competence protein ComEC